MVSDLASIRNVDDFIKIVANFRCRCRGRGAIKSAVSVSHYSQNNGFVARRQS